MIAGPTLLAFPLALFVSAQTSAPLERPALIVAAEQGETELVHAILLLGTNILVRDSHGRTALTAAIAAGKRATATEIIAFVHDAVREPIPEITKDNQLAVASGIAAVEVRDELLNAVDDNGTTALMLAARNGWRETVETLLTDGGSAKLLDKQGRSASAYAEAAGHPELAEYLRNVEKKPDKS